MKKYWTLLALLLILVVALVACNDKPNNPDNTPPEIPVADKTVTQTKVVMYDGPQAISTSQVASVKIEGREAFVYDTRVNHGRSFTFVASKDYNQAVIFDFEGRVNVEIEIKNATSLYNVVVRPLAKQVTPTISGNKISFQLSYNDNYVVEYGTTETERASQNAIHLFANPIETDGVDPENLPEKTVYVGPGIWMASALPVSEDGTTIYLAGGAVVYGQIRTANIKNLVIKGRGILAGEIFNRTRDSEFTLPIELQNCKDVTIKDIAIFDPAGWAITLYCCEDIQINNIKIITARGNGDGISVQSCKNVNVKGGFVRTWDDSLVVKNVDNKPTDNITFDGVYVWTDLAQSMEVGFETYGPTMENITFKNITVLHNFHKAAMSIHNADNANISKVVYENITIEDAQMLGDNQLDGENDYLIDITIAYNTEWTHSGGERGKVFDITFRNIKVLKMASSIVCRMQGDGPNSDIKNINISDVEIEGTKVTNLQGLKLTPGVFASNINYSNSGSVTGAIVGLPYKLELAQDSTPEITTKTNIMQDGLQIPEFAMQNVEPPYAGKIIDTTGVTVTATYGEGDRANSEWNKGPVTDKEGKGIANLLDGDRSTEWVFDAWTGVANEFVAINFDFGKPTKIGNIRFKGSTASDILRYYTISMFIKTTENATKWTRFQVEKDIAISPLSSNYVDYLMNLDSYSKEGCYALQLRIFAKNDLTHPATIALGEIEFYPPSLTTNKPASASEHEDVYDINNVNDGNTYTYFESKKGTFPAYIQIDMGNAENVKYITMHLPPSLTWEPRTQTIEIQGSLDGVTFFTIVASAEYTFDSSEGNVIVIVLDASVQARYIKLVYTSNSTGYGAQLSELYVYGE